MENVTIKTMLRVTKDDGQTAEQEEYEIVQEFSEMINKPLYQTAIHALNTLLINLAMSKKR